MPLAIEFHGGARSVTGACYLVDTGEKKILIDCGLVQGGRFCEPKNAEDFGFDPGSIDALFVTHAHLDHVGRIPRLVKEGFKGTIYSTAPTKELAALILEDGFGIMEHESKACNEEPPYRIEHIAEALRYWETIEYEKPIQAGDASITLRRAGHILGSSMVEVMADGKKIVFSGDLGTVHSLLLPPADPVDGIDVLVTEAAYGDRTHPSIEEARLTLERTLEDAVGRGGTLMIPAFATERTQDILFLLNELVIQKRVPEIPVFVDSPLAIKITSVFEKYPAFYNDAVRELFGKHPHLFESRSLKYTASVDESKAINEVPPPKVIVAGSGMMTGGRILHHLKRYLPDERSILMVVGYQVVGSLGRRIMDGAETVRILGEDVPVRAAVVEAHGFSAHADRDKLYAFIAAQRDTLRHVFCVQGEQAASTALAQRVKDHLGIPADVPELHQRFEL